MRISDWSSDVCSSDLILRSEATNDPRLHHIRFRDFVTDPAAVIAPIYEEHGIPFTNAFRDKINERIADPNHRADRYGKFEYHLDTFGFRKSDLRKEFAEYCDRFDIRSEEHTFELQSLMRISYAVFCL